jgi:hypothetical protein
MHFKNFDTHKYIKEFQASGFNEQQAEMLVRSLLEARDSDLSNLATREQVTKLEMNFEKKFSALEKKMDQDINATREQISTLDKKIDQNISTLDKKIDQNISTLDRKIDQVENKLIVEITKIKSEMTAEMSKNKYDTVKWMVSLFITLVVTILVRPYFH